jgi:hypothetical protein
MGYESGKSKNNPFNGIMEGMIFSKLYAAHPDPTNTPYLFSGSKPYFTVPTCSCLPCCCRSAAHMPTVPATITAGGISEMNFVQLA